MHHPVSVPPSSCETFWVGEGRPEVDQAWEEGGKDGHRGCYHPQRMVTEVLALEPNTDLFGSVLAQ